MHDLPQESSSNLRRLLILTYGVPSIKTDNWERLSAVGWSWHANIKLADYTVAVQVIRLLQDEHGKGNVTVGQPFNNTKQRPDAESTSVCGIYLRDIRGIIFSLHRDMANWERLTQEQVDEL